VKSACCLSWGDIPIEERSSEGNVARLNVIGFLGLHSEPSRRSTERFDSRLHSNGPNLIEA